VNARRYVAATVKNKANTVRDKYNQARECLNGGVSKCVKDTAKKAVKAVGETVKNTYNAIKEDPWKFVATAAVGILATVAVGALCATGVGCLILAGAVAGAMQAGAGYMVDVARGDAEFSWHGLADTMIEGGLDGALSAGVSKFTGGATKYLTKGAGGAASGLKKMIGGGGAKTADLPKRAGGGERPGSAARGGDGSGGSGGSAGGKHRTDEKDSGDGSGDGSTCKRPPTRHSFSPDTLVLLAGGTNRAIKDVAVGDQVLSTDPETGVTEAKTVEALHLNKDTDLTDVTVITHDSGKDHEATLHTTWHHPFWNETKHDWVYAQDLKTGDLLHTDSGTLVEVKNVHNTVGAADMRDLTIDQIHTYYVIAGDTPVLVHNTPCDPVSIYKAPWKGMTDKILDNGFDPADFPGSGNGFPDGNAYFGMHENGKSIALDYAGRGGYDGRVVEVRIPRADFDQHFSRYVTKYDGQADAQIAIPNTVFDQLNQYPRFEVGGS